MWEKDQNNSAENNRVEYQGKHILFFKGAKSRPLILFNKQIIIL